MIFMYFHVFSLRLQVPIMSIGENAQGFKVVLGVWNMFAMILDSVKMGPSSQVTLIFLLGGSTTNQNQ